MGAMDTMPAAPATLRLPVSIPHGDRLDFRVEADARDAPVLVFTVNGKPAFTHGSGGLQVQNVDAVQLFDFTVLGRYGL